MLELVSQRHAPVGAYDVLGALRKGEGALAPPTVYRALEFLIEAGLIHRIDTLNAFIACVSPEEMHAGQFLVCRTCSRVTEGGGIRERFAVGRDQGCVRRLQSGVFCLKLCSEFVEYRFP